ncbi:EscI/YscI/HrpB family type III secretion system inner rod protein [Pseudomonas cichorii]|uniref:EscI/YscI/HrpB family type III secretion system inner rod protein n=1 Tax=Pseudomonas syringae group TaxID=136849 RepID=UPI0018E5F531|nr:EscI/YscI/HrpB family type III secretion system inner rod protein [Pseudomonas cichorii]MBI6854916.1 EscI/YscI/HrpB family type III secretion system inner rod protein [Pseudomonas cichorii]MBX8485613.1 EscI/YscI/HrpB family type III secretion system inner rod protein [Pseudomonas cichorii]MBX8510900.1 EscI/YscI/HrpB family type III secretion system inner rod protein [Pseudomonas cichorii]MBX8525733.1 EscI/YscI/HrpB family type III secretion system inner rod protein [Pseudomonas cichorii]MBX
MAVTRVSTHHTGLFETEVTSPPSGPTPAEADIAWFNAAMRSADPKPASDSQMLVSPISKASTAYQKESERVDRDLQRAARSSDPKMALDANRSLSSFYLESLLSAKLVSKAAQTVEKLTSLQ